MANNRMFLVHDETGQRIAIARHYGHGWAAYDGAVIDKRLDEALQAEVKVTGFPSTGWHIEFSNHTEHDDPLKPSTTTCWQGSDGRGHDGDRPSESREAVMSGQDDQETAEERSARISAVDASYLEVFKKDFLVAPAEVRHRGELIQAKHKALRALPLEDFLYLSKICNDDYDLTAGRVESRIRWLLE